MRFYDFLGFEGFVFSDFYKEAQGFDVLAVLYGVWVFGRVYSGLWRLISGREKFMV